MVHPGEDAPIAASNGKAGSKSPQRKAASPQKGGAKEASPAKKGGQDEAGDKRKPEAAAEKSESPKKAKK